MKASKFAVLSLVAILGIAFVGYVVAADAEKLEVKAGQKYFVCNCGEKCRCNAVSTVEGKCPCGKDMVEAMAVKVDSDRVWRIPATVEGGTARFKAEGWEKEQTFDIVAKFSCATGGCKMISQMPGRCSCGGDMKVEKLVPLDPS